VRSRGGEADDARRDPLFYPRLYLGAGIRVVGAADDYSRWEVEMKLAHYTAITRSSLR